MLFVTSIEIREQEREMINVHLRKLLAKLSNDNPGNYSTVSRYVYLIREESKQKCYQDKFCSKKQTKTNSYTQLRKHSVCPRRKKKSTCNTWLLFILLLQNSTLTTRSLIQPAESALTTHTERETQTATWLTVCSAGLLTIWASAGCPSRVQESAKHYALINPMYWQYRGLDTVLYAEPSSFKPWF